MISLYFNSQIIIIILADIKLYAVSVLCKLCIELLFRELLLILLFSLKDLYLQFFIMGIYSASRFFPKFYPIALRNVTAYSVTDFTERIFKIIMQYYI